LSVTTLPFMEAIEQDDSRHAPDWFVIECELCWPDWQTLGGRLHVCEDEAADHLHERHPRRHARARAQRLIHYRALVAAQTQHLQSPYPH